MNLRKVKSENLFFFLPYGIFLIFSILSTSLYYKFFYGAIYTCILLFCFSALVGGMLFVLQYDQKSFEDLIICWIVYILIGLINKNMISTLAYIPLFVYASRNIKFDKIAWFTIRVSLMTIFFIIITAYIGVIDNHIVHSATGRVREYLGFRFALFPAAFVFNVTCLWLYLKRERIRFFEAVCLFTLNYYIYIKTDSRLSFYLSVILITLFVINGIKPGIIFRQNAIYTVLTMSFILCFIVSLLLVFCYARGLSWAYLVNDFLGNRLQYAWQSLITNGVSLWGKEIEWNGYGLDIFGQVSDAVYGTYTYVDCMYIKILQRYGMVCTIIYLIAFTLVMLKEKKKSNYCIVLILSFYAIRCLIDDLAMYLYYNTFWLYIGTSLMASIQSIKNRERSDLKMIEK